MADDATSTTDAAAQTSDDSATTASATGATTDVIDGQDALGDAGKKALDAMKAKWKAAEEAQRKLAADFDAFRAKAEGKEAELAAAQEAQRVRDEAISAANDRIRKAEVRAAAAGKLNDPTDALRYLDLSEIEVGSDGEVDATAVAAAIDDLIKNKPYLAAQGGQRFQGPADGGARTDATKPAQLSKADLERMSREGKYDEITAAKAAGQFNDLLGIKP